MDHLHAIRAAESRIRPVVFRTPMQRLRGQVWLKREDLQFTGSFKLRGAANVVRLAVERGSIRGIVCASSGNLGCALGVLGGELGLPVVVYAPRSIHPAKESRLRRLGVELVVVPCSFNVAARCAQAYSLGERYTYCSSGSSWAFSHGCGTMVAEIVGAVAGLSRIYVPVGGGGLAAGLGLALHGLPEGLRPGLVGVQVVGSVSVAEYFYQCALPSAGPDSSAADCLIGDLEDNSVILRVGRRVLTEVIVVADEEIIAARDRLLDMGIDAEPGAVVGYAGYLQQHRAGQAVEPVCAVITGRGYI